MAGLEAFADRIALFFQQHGDQLAKIGSAASATLTALVAGMQFAVARRDLARSRTLAASAPRAPVLPVAEPDLAAIKAQIREELRAELAAEVHAAEPSRVAQPSPNEVGSDGGGDDPPRATEHARNPRTTAPDRKFGALYVPTGREVDIYGVQRTSAWARRHDGDTSRIAARLESHEAFTNGWPAPAPSTPSPIIDLTFTAIGLLALVGVLYFTGNFVQPSPLGAAAAVFLLHWLARKRWTAVLVALLVGLHLLGMLAAHTFSLCLTVLLLGFPLRGAVARESVLAVLAKTTVALALIAWIV